MNFYLKQGYLQEMKQAITHIFLTLIFLLISSTVSSEGLDSHSAYSVTSYNLGAIIDYQDGDNAHPENFRPLLITNTASDILNSEHEGTASWAETAPHATSTNGIALSAHFNPTQKLSLQGTFGVTRNLWTPDNINYEQESSWEANLGVVYRFLNNLSYELHLGYMDTGDLFTERNTYSDVESIIMVSNKLTLSF